MRKSIVLGSGLALATVVLLLVGGAVVAGERCSIEGAVATASGRPVASVWVVLTRSGQEQARSLTGDDGRYYMGALEPGQYVIAVTKDGRTIFQAAVTLRARELYDITLR